MERTQLPSERENFGDERERDLDRETLSLSDNKKSNLVPADSALVPVKSLPRGPPFLPFLILPRKKEEKRRNALTAGSPGLPSVSATTITPRQRKGKKRFFFFALHWQLTFSLFRFLQQITADSLVPRPPPSIYPFSPFAHHPDRFFSAECPPAPARWPSWPRARPRRPPRRARSAAVAPRHRFASAAGARSRRSRPLALRPPRVPSPRRSRPELAEPPPRRCRRSRRSRRKRWPRRHLPRPLLRRRRRARRNSSPLPEPTRSPPSPPTSSAP